MNTTSISESLLMSLVGMLIVFGILAVMMVVIILRNKMLGSKRSKDNGGTDSPAVSKLTMISGSLAPGSSGDVKTFDVPDRIAAMVMSIVADQMEFPLNELRFKSIKQVEAE